MVEEPIDPVVTNLGHAGAPFEVVTDFDVERTELTRTRLGRWCA